MREKIEVLGIPVYSLGMRRGLPTPRVLLRLRRLVRKYSPDLIQGWMYHGNIAAWLAAKISGGHPKVYWNVRHSIYNIAYEKRMTRMLIHLGSCLSNCVDTVIYNSAISMKQHEALGYVSNRSVRIPNGFDIAMFHPDDDAARSVIQELVVYNSVPRIGLIGRYHEMKDHERFLKAARIVLKYRKDTRFLLAGRGVDSTNKALMILVEVNGLQDSIFLLGERPDIPRLMVSLDIACSSSYYGEGFPNVIGEAMACGVPCVVTDVGDAAWVVGDTGRVVPPRNPHALAEGIIQLLDLPECERKALGVCARSRIEEDFALDKIVRQYETLYTK